MRAVRQCWVVAVILAGMFSAGASLEAQVRRALFASSAPGWMHVIHPAHLRANVDGTGAVTVDDPVAWIEDVSGNEIHSSQATSTSRAILKRAASGRYYLQSDGADDGYDFAPVSVANAGGRVIGLAALIKNTGTRVLVGRSADDVKGYVGQVSAKLVYNERSLLGPLASTPADPSSMVASVRSGIPHFMVNGSEADGELIADARTYSSLLHQNGTYRVRGDYYGGTLAVMEPTVDTVALVRRWLDKLRGA